jgi:hypothetical protein
MYLGLLQQQHCPVCPPEAATSPMLAMTGFFWASWRISRHIRSEARASPPAGNHTCRPFACVRACMNRGWAPCWMWRSAAGCSQGEESCDSACAATMEPAHQRDSMRLPTWRVNPEHHSRRALVLGQGPQLGDDGVGGDHAAAGVAARACRTRRKWRSGCWSHPSTISKQTPCCVPLPPPNMQPVPAGAQRAAATYPGWRRWRAAPR